MLRHLLPFLACILLHATLAAQPPTRSLKSVKSDVEFHASNYGMFGLDLAKLTGGFIVPRGSGNIYMFGGGVYFVARKTHNGMPSFPVAFWTYDMQSAVSDATPGDLRGDESDEGDRIYHSELYDRATGRFTGSSNQSVWPLWLLPGTTATAMSPGIYVSEKSRRVDHGGLAGPAFLSGVDEQIVTRFHDTTISRYSGPAESLEGLPIGLQFQQSIYAWSDGPFKHVVVLKYDVVNISGASITHCSIGQLADIDVGDGRNDYFEYYSKRPELRLGYGWTAAESYPYGSILMVQLEGPVVNEDGYIDNARRREFQQSGRAGTCRGWAIETDPARGAFYDFATAGTSGPNGFVGDIRGMIGTGLFSMHPGDTAHFAMAFAVIPDRPGTSQGDAQVEALVPLLNEHYYQGFPASAPASQQGEKELDLTLLSGTGDNDLRVRFSAGSHADATLRLFDPLGRPVTKLTRRMYDGEIAEESIDMSALPSGLYFVELSSGGKRVAEKMVKH